MKRLPAPVANFISEASYAEDRRGVPFKIQLFMLGARMAAQTILWYTPMIIILHISDPTWDLILGFSVFVPGQVITSIHRWDIFTPLGFRMFKRFIEVKE